MEDSDSTDSEGQASQGNTNWQRIGGLSGLASGVLFALLWISAVAVNPEWRFGSDTLSELGGDNEPSRWLFNLGCISSGVLGIIFSSGLYGRLSDVWTGKLGGALMAVASAGLILVGVFSIDRGTAHSAATVFFFSTIGATAVAVLYTLVTARRENRWVAVLTAAVISISIASLAIAEIPLAEAITVICLICWLSATGYWLLLPQPGEK